MHGKGGTHSNSDIGIFIECDLIVAVDGWGCDCLWCICYYGRWCGLHSKA